MLIARQYGWLNAAVEHADKRTPESRAKQYKDANQPAPLPELDAGHYFLDMLMEAGPVKSAPMGGAEGLDWSDIAAYLVEYPVAVDHEERSLLRRMSQAYAAGLSEGTSPFSISPMDRETSED